MKMKRREFLALAGAAGAAGAVTLPVLDARAATRRPDDTPAVLVDATRCVGCRACEAACAESNGLPGPQGPGDAAVFDKPRDLTTQAFTVVNRVAQESGEARHVKKQCMHCLEPACASACPVKALEKTAAGPVIYTKERCIGCRYCLVACPFEIPRYEYEKVNPYVRKCTFCADRQAQGKAPACASVCPSGALTFGKRREMLELARTRVWGSPEKYEHHVYGEHEAGGTSWLYIADRSFAQMGFKTEVRTSAYTELTQGALGMVPFVMTLWPPLLMGFRTFAQRRQEGEGGHGEPHGATHEAPPPDGAQQGGRHE